VNAAEVKQALRRRHPATGAMGTRIVPGPWTCIEECLGCDLLAIAAQRDPPPKTGVRFPRVGYEVKVSRGDYRQELRNPHKRAAAVLQTNVFYFAVPAGLLKREELALRGHPSDDEQLALRANGAGPLWVPEDVGLVEITGAGVRVVVQSPVRRGVPALDPAALGAFARFVSAHPDPRHAGVVDADRAYCADLRRRYVA
jgi:hypothetical protein